MGPRRAWDPEECDRPAEPLLLSRQVTPEPIDTRSGVLDGPSPLPVLLRPQAASLGSPPPPPGPLRSEATAAASGGLLGRGSLIMMAGTLLFFALSSLGYVLAARLLPVPAWGLFSLGVSFTSFLSVLLVLGLQNAIARWLVLERDPSAQRQLVRWALGISAATSVAGSVGTFLFAGTIAGAFHQPGLTPVLELLAVSVGLGAITPVVAGIFQGFHDMVPNALFNQVLNPAVFLVFVAGVVWLHWGLTGALVGYVVADVAGFVGSLAYYERRISRYLPGGGTSRGHPLPRLGDAVSLWAMGSLAFVTAYADTLLLGAFRPAVLVGYYSSSMALARTIPLLVAALTFVFLPLGARLARDGDLPALRTAYTVGTRWILLIALPLFLLFVLLPSQTVVEVFGVRYLPAAPALQVLGGTAFAVACIGPSNACLAGLSRDRALLVGAGASAAANVALSVTLIPLFGVLGAATAWGVARAIYPAASLLVLYRDYGIHPFRSIVWRPVVLATAVAAPVIVVAGNLPVGAWVVAPLLVGGLAATIASLYVTRTFLPDDLEAVHLFERMVGIRLPRLCAVVASRLSGSPTSPS